MRVVGVGVVGVGVLGDGVLGIGTLCLLIGKKPRIAQQRLIDNFFQGLLFVASSISSSQHNKEATMDEGKFDALKGKAVFFTGGTYQDE